ncbi:MAG: hypothetical protein ACXV8G_12390 [Acidimicrobiales bacterium]
MYQNVIVPNDGTLEGRSALAPAADLAWRCGARVVNVSNTELSDKSSKAAVKGHAIAQSAADVEFWVDLENDLPVAVLAAAQYRTNPIYCVPSPPTRGLLGRRKGVLAPLAAEVATRAEAAVVVVGPVVDIARGLPMTELVAVLDGRDGSDELVVLAEQWAQLFKLRLVLTAVAGPGSIDTARASSSTSTSAPMPAGRPAGWGSSSSRATTPSAGSSICWLSTRTAWPCCRRRPSAPRPAPWPST